MSNQNKFNPYLKWLGIPLHEQPPHAYRLLGIQAFEHDEEVIHNAADQRMLSLRTYQNGEYGRESQKLLNEVASARITLSDPRKRDAYDVQLKQVLEQAARGASAAQAPAQPASPPAAVAPVTLTPVATPQTAAVPNSQFVAPQVTDTAKFVNTGKGNYRAKSRKRRTISTVIMSLFMGMGLLVCGTIAWYLFQNMNSIAPNPNEEISQKDTENLVPEKEVPEKEVPEKEVPEKEVPEKEVPEKVPEKELSNGNRPDGNRPNGNRPNGNRPDGNRPNGNRPDGNRPDGNRPDENRPDENRPDEKHPDEKHPRKRVPDAAWIKKQLEPVVEKRLPVPSESHAALCQENIHGRYDLETAKSHSQQKEKADLLVAELKNETKDGMRHAMYMEAAKLYYSSNDFASAVQVYEKLALEFQEDPVQLKHSFFKKVLKSKPKVKGGMEVALQGVAELIRGGHWDAAHDCLNLAEPKLQNATLAKLHKKNFDQQRHELLLLYPQRKAYQQALARLKNGATDPRALSVVGAWFCSREMERFEQGAQLLDSTEKKYSQWWSTLLSMEQDVRPSNLGSVLEIADQYCKKIRSYSIANCYAFRLRAIHWYQHALSLSGTEAEKAIATKRLQILMSKNWQSQIAKEFVSSRPDLLIAKCPFKIKSDSGIRFTRIQFLPNSTKLFSVGSGHFQITDILGEKVDSKKTTGNVIFKPSTSAIAPSGKQFIALVDGKKPRALAVFNTTTGEINNKAMFEIENEPVQCIWTPDEKKILINDSEGFFYLKAGPLTELESKTGKISRQMKYSDSGDALALLQKYSIVVAKQGREVKLYRNYPLVRVGFADNERLLTCIDEIGQITVWELGSKEVIAEFSTGARDIKGFYTIPKTDNLVIVKENSIQVWNFRTKTVVNSLSSANSIVDSSLSTDGRLLAVIDTSGVINVYTFR